VYRNRQKLTPPIARTNLGRPQLNRKNPIAENITDAYLFCNANGPPVNLANSVNRATVTSGPGYKASLGGVGGYGTGGKYFSLPYTALVAADTISWTVRIRFLSVSSTGGFMAVADGAARRIACFLGSGGVASFGAVFGVTFAGTYPIGKVCEIVVTGLGGTPYTGICYANGVQAGTGTWVTSAVESLILGNNISGGGSNPDDIYYEATFWKRRLSAAEVKSLYLNPEQLYIYPEISRVGALSPITGTIAITEGADVVAATLNSTFNVAIDITETADSIAATLTAAAVAGAGSQHPYQPILTVGRMMGR
jgi:hypothetical protein